MALVKDLSHIAGFSTLSGEALEAIQRVAVARTFSPRQVVFVAGEPSEGLWFLKEGQVKIFRLSSEGRQQDFCMMRAGMCCGCPLFFGDVNPAWAEAIDTVTFYFIEGGVALDLADRYPEIGRILFRVFAKGERVLASLVAGLSGSSVVTRVAQVLMDHAGAGDAAAGSRSPRLVALSHQELADLVGTSREGVTRCLDALERAHIVALGRKRITVLDAGRLASITDSRCPLGPRGAEPRAPETPGML